MNSAFAAGYTCPAYKKYTSCSSGYYLSNCGSSTSNWKGQTIAESALAAGNSCIKGADTAYTYAGGRVCPKLNSISCDAGTYWDGTKQECASCTVGNYCPGFSNVTGPTDGQGLSACPTNYTSAAGATAQTSCYRTVTLSKNGGSGTINGVTGTASATYTCYYNSTCALPSPSGLTNTYYNYLGGWGTATTCTSTSRNVTVTSTATSVMYYACRQGKQTTITFELNGGVNNLPEQKTATYGSAMPALGTTANPTRTGYTFMGWYDNATYTSGTQYYNTSRGSARTWNKSSSTATLYAGWKANAYTCSAGNYLRASDATCVACPAGKYCNGGTFTFNGSNQGITGNVSAGYYSTGGALSATPTGPQPSTSTDVCLSGYSCGTIAAGRWGAAGATSANGSGAVSAGYYSTGGATSATPTAAGNGCLSGKSCGVCTSGYSTGGATAATCTACTYGATSGTTAADHDAASDCKKTITLNKNGGSGTIQGTTGTTNATITCSQGAACNFGSASGLTQSGYAFSGGWGTSTSCTATTTSFTNPANATYYACKTANVYTITFNATQNGGTGGAATVYEKYGVGYSLTNFGTTVTSVTIPTKSGSVFNGYYTAASAGTQRITAAGVLPSNTTFTANATLYAQYSACAACTKGTGVSTCAMSVSSNKCTYSATCSAGYNTPTCTAAGACSCTPNTYTISINTNSPTSGTPSATSVSCKYGANCTLPTQGTMVKTKMVFLGWNTKADGTGTNYAAGATVSNLTTTNNGTVTLYAKWQTPTCSATNGTATLSGVTDNKPVCAITCSVGYSQGGGANTTGSFNVTGVAGATSASGTCSVRSITCAAAQYLNGVTCTDCGTGYYCPASEKTYTYNGSIQGRSGCPSGYGASDAKATSADKCYLTTTATKYVAEAGKGQVTCAAGGACAGGVKVYYNATGGRVACASPNYAAAGASACSACSALSGVSVVGGTYASVSPFNASTTCRYTAPAKTISGCKTVTTNQVSYDGSKWATTTYNVTADGGYIIAGNGTADATCNACADSTYSAGGSATSCAKCSDLTPAVSVTGGAYSSAAPRNANTTCRYKAPTPPLPTYCATKTSNTIAYGGTAWGTNIYSVTAKAGAIISGNNSANATCSQCAAGTYSAGNTATSCTACTNKPANSAYIGNATSNSCPWECNSGYNKTSANLCAQLCTAGITTMNLGNGVSAPLYAAKQTTHAIGVDYKGKVCYVSLATGNASGALNVSISGTSYHTVE